MTQLEDKVREHYRSKALPEDFMNALLAEAEAVTEVAPVSRPTSWRSVLNLLLGNPIQSVIAASVLILAAAFVHNYGVHAERTERAVKEVAMNHTTRFELEYAGQTIAALDKSMSLLPFELSLPARVRKQYHVQGARYCSLSGQLAAHVKLIDRETNKSISVFMTRAADELDVINNSSAAIDGVNVNIWRESGLLYALVGS